MTNTERLIQSLTSVFRSTYEIMLNVVLQIHTQITNTSTCFLNLGLTFVDKSQIQVDTAKATATIKFQNSQSVKSILLQTNGVLNIRNNSIQLSLSVSYILFLCINKALLEYLIGYSNITCPS